MGAPTLRVERALLRSGVLALACADEAGRGALAGPVALGVVLVTADTRPAPRGVRDSKLLSPAQRLSLVPLIRAWAAHSVGMASAQEIDRLGIVAAMRLAGRRALAELPRNADRVLLDGSHDYLSTPAQASLLEEEELPQAPPVVTLVKADLRCAGVAAASILAKTARDAVLADLDCAFPDYGWSENKGYGAPEHLEALARLGPTPHHRRSWNLPGGTGPAISSLDQPSGR